MGRIWDSKSTFFADEAWRAGVAGLAGVSPKAGGARRRVTPNIQ
jgi:hypothetical protein